MSNDFDLTPGERELLDAAEDDYIDISWALIHLGIRHNGGVGSARASAEEIAAGFDSLTRLHERGLIEVGRLEYDDGGSPGRVAPVRHVSEPIDAVRQRVLDAATNETDPAGWYFSAWIESTDTTSAAT